MSVPLGILASGLVAAVLLLLSSPLLYRGLKHRSRYRRFADAPVRTPTSVSPGETALVSGVARPNEEGTRTAPISRQPALLAAWDVHSLRRWGAFRAKHTWAVEALGMETNGFLIRGEETAVAVQHWQRRDRLEGTDRLRMSRTGEMPARGIDVNDVWMEIESFDTDVRVRPDADLAASQRDLAADLGIDVADRSLGILPSRLRVRTPSGTLRFREAALETGDDVTVFGQVRPSSGSEPSLRIERPSDAPALVSPLDPETLLARYRWSYRKLVHLPIVLVLVVAPLIGFGSTF